jgi:hypothetical protein
VEAQVLSGREQGERVIPEVPYTSIAAITEQSADAASKVIMIDGELL